MVVLKLEVIVMEKEVICLWCLLGCLEEFLGKVILVLDNLNEMLVKELF